MIRGRLVGWAIACHDIDEALARARATGFDPGDVIEGNAVTTTGSRLWWRLTRNALTGGLIPFLISWGETTHPRLVSASWTRSRITAHRASGSAIPSEPS